MVGVNRKGACHGRVESAVRVKGKWKFMQINETNP